MPTELCQHDGHRCLVFTDRYDGAGGAVPANPVQIVEGSTGAPLFGAAVGEFIACARGLQCGIDLMGPANCTVPR